AGVALDAVHGDLERPVIRLDERVRPFDLGGDHVSDGARQASDVFERDDEAGSVFDLDSGYGLDRNDAGFG
ncbi:hypothetical protein ABTN29_20610, partial [Acinetobacter baumannii]